MLSPPCQGWKRPRDRSPTPHSREKATRTLPQITPGVGAILDTVPPVSRALLQTELDLVIELGESGQVLTPFVPALVAVKLPKRFMKHDIKHYDDNTDPKKFLNTYKYTLDNRGCTPEQMCKLFPEYLEGVANDWFNVLPKGTILIFCELGTTFLNRFFKKSSTLEATVDILNVKQRSNESLSNYITKFTSETLRLRCPSDEVIRTTFHNGLQVKPLYDKLVRHPPASSHDMWTTVQKYVATKDSARRKTEQEANPRKSNTGKARNRADKGRSAFDRLNKGRLEQKIDASQLIPLTKSSTDILSLNKDVLRPPLPM